MFVADGVAYVGSQDGALRVLRAGDGALLWHTKAGEFVLGIAAGVAYISTLDGGLDALRARDGSLLWHYSRTQKKV